MGKYATAVSEETGIPPLAIQAVEMADKPIKETRLAKELKVTPPRLCMHATLVFVLFILHDFFTCNLG